MNPNQLSNETLINDFENAVRSERKITAQVLKYIAEIDRRRLFVEKNHSSLFDYLTKDCGYSPGSASRRIAAARLLREIPETAKKFEEGTLTLSQANQVQCAVRDLKKAKNTILKPEQKRELIQQIENSTQKQTEQILAANLNLDFIPTQKETFHRDQSVTLTITFRHEQIQILEQAQNMVSHIVPDKNWAGVMTYLAQREISRRTTKRTDQKLDLTTKSATSVILNKSPSSLHSKTVNFIAVPQRKPISSVLRKTLLHLNAVCAYKYENGKLCGSRRFLQIDHIQSVSEGGNNAPNNLQVLCGFHNRLKYNNVI